MEYTVLTLTQPYASLVALGVKTFETRDWGTRYRDMLLIHAGKGLVPVGGRAGLIELCLSEPFRSVLLAADVLRLGQRHDIDRHPNWFHLESTPGAHEPYSLLLPRAAIVASTQLIDCCPLSIQNGRACYWNQDKGVWKVVSEQEAAFGDFSEGRRGFRLTDIQALPTPIPARGALGLWRWEGEVSTMRLPEQSLRSLPRIAGYRWKPRRSEDWPHPGAQWHADLCTRDGTPVAYLSIVVHSEHLILRHIFVHRNFRGGLGGRMLQALCLAYQDLPIQLRVAVDPDDAPLTEAQLTAWYARHGFVPDARRPGWLIRPKG
jgi:activating signal cointegrator 1